MNSSTEESNFRKIYKNISCYLPSRFLIIFSAAFIIPLLSNTIDYVQMSIYLIAIQILNLVCTTSSDGIGKIVLRFYEKYKLQNKLDVFFSSVFWLSIIIYLLIWVLYFLGHDFVSEKFSISNNTLMLILLLVIPCGIRQFLYQILRVYHEAFLYTFSIVLYQILFIIFIVTGVKHYSSANAVLISMMLSIFAIDMFILRKVSLPKKLLFHLDKNIVYEILIYSIPLFFTNTCYWAMLHISKFIFQYSHEYSNTAIAGATSTFVNMVIQPLVTVFIFATFPILVKKYELRKKLKSFFTNLVQFYCVIFIPLICTFCFYTKQITNLIFPESYGKIYLLLPFYTITICLHELTKLVNVKYHLKNIIHVELGIACITAILAIALNFYFINLYGLIGAAFAIFLCECILLFLNLLVRSKKLNYISYTKIFKTGVLALGVSVIVFTALSLIFSEHNRYTNLLEILLFVSFTYYICYTFRDKILY